jgi:glucan endo-1,3-alpha-glucosidase
MWAVAFATSEATVTLQCGSSSSTFTVTPGVNKLNIPLSPGGMSVKMVRNGQTIISETAQGYTYILNPALCEFFFFPQVIGQGSYLTHNFF